jgi:hypothetical protein
MYYHIGKKVRYLAVALCIIGVLASIGTGVYLYAEEKLDVVPCLAICVGGSLLFWLSSWVLYCIGDTHVRIERLEDKLIPKPAYAEYLATNNANRGTCEICGRTTDLIDAKIEDKMGVRFRKVCRECFAANNCQEAN